MSKEGNGETVNIQIKALQIGDISFPQECDLVVKYINGMKEGEGKVLSEKRIILAKLNYHEDMLDGLCCFYDSKGRKIYVCVFHNNEMRELYIMKEGQQMKRYGFIGKSMIEYNEDAIIYEGEYEGNTERGYTRNGIGTYFISQNKCITAVFERGVEKRKLKECSKEEMKEFDERGRIIYRGGYKKNDHEYFRNGDGMLYEYDKESLKEVYDCENGEKKVKKYDFRLNVMREFGEKDRMIYEGGYVGTIESGFWRNGKGDEYDDNGELIYSGEWKKGERKGKGKYYHDGTLIYEGNWSEGKPNGRGKYHQNGIVVKEGEWENGYLHLTGSKWFNYFTGKEDRIIALKKGSLSKWLKEKVLIKEVDDNERNGKAKLISLLLIIGIMIVCLLFFSVFVYYLYCIMREDAVIHNEFEMMNIGKNVKRIVVNEGVGNNMRVNLTISNYPYLQEFYVKGNALLRLNSLIISDNPLLNNITIGDDSSYTCSSVKNLVLKSMMIYD